MSAQRSENPRAASYVAQLTRRIQQLSIAHVGERPDERGARKAILDRRDAERLDAAKVEAPQIAKRVLGLTPPSVDACLALHLSLSLFPLSTSRERALIFIFSP